MKRFLLLVFFAAMVCNSRATTQYREFTSADGKTIRGAVKAYDARTKTVTIEREDKRTSTAPISALSESDQAYILEWDAAKGFLSDSLLRVSCDKKRISQRKEKEWRDVSFVGGGSEKTLLKETTFEEIAYEMQFRNMGKAALSDIRMEYTIYYEQSEIARNEQPELEQKFFKDELPLPPLEPRNNVVVSTKPVEIHDDNVNAISWADGSVFVGGEGEVHGVRVRLYMKMPSGKEVMREFCHPDKLSEEEFPWKD